MSVGFYTCYRQQAEQMTRQELASDVAAAPRFADCIASCVLEYSLSAIHLRVWVLAPQPTIAFAEIHPIST